VYQSLRKLIETQDEATEAGTLEISFGTINEHHLLFEKDNANLQTQDTKIRELQSNLSSQELRLMKEEKKLVDLILMLCLALGFDVDEAHSELSVSSELAVLPSESQNRLTLEYYDRKGDIQILKERLLDLDYEHREEQEQRGMLFDQLQPDSEWEMGDSESESRRKYEDKRHQILMEIVATEQDTDRLERKCNEARVELELWPTSNVDAQCAHEMEPVIREQPKVAYVVPARIGRFLAPNAAAAATSLTAEKQSASIDDNPNAKPTQSRRHIRQWLDEVAASPDLLPDLLPPEVELGQSSINFRVL
jgi:hypothetical protein